MKVFSLSSSSSVLFGVSVFCILLLQNVDAKGKKSKGNTTTTPSTDDVDDSDEDSKEITTPKPSGSAEGRSILPQEPQLPPASDGSRSIGSMGMGMPGNMMMNNPGGGGQMVDSTRPGCTGTKCMDISEEQKAAGCKAKYPDASAGPGILTCCPTWVCESSSGSYNSDSSSTGSAGNFPSGPPPNYQLNPVISNPLPPGSNLNYNTNRQSFSQGGPGMNANGQSSSYQYSTSSFNSNGNGPPPQMAQMGMGNMPMGNMGMGNMGMGNMGMNPYMQMPMNG